MFHARDAPLSVPDFSASPYSTPTSASYSSLARYSLLAVRGVVPASAVTYRVRAHHVVEVAHSALVTAARRATRYKGVVSAEAGL